MHLVQPPVKPASEEEQRLYSIPAAAKYLGTSRDYVYDRINDGELACVELGTNVRSKRRVRADDLQRFVESRTHRVTSLKQASA